MSGVIFEKDEKYTDGKAFDLEQINRVMPEIVLLSTDSINETVLMRKILSFNNITEFFCVAVQLALAGFGGASYKQYKFNKKDCELSAFFKKYEVKVGVIGSNVIKPDELTPRRIIRVFKRQISQLLLKRQDLSSYLYTKYTDCDESMRAYCFAGSEHYCETEQQAQYLYNAYKRLDDNLKLQGKQSGIVDRIRRVLFARGFRHIK